jgi:hypothetical protein
MERIAAAQALVIGMLFVWSGSWKVFVPRARKLAAESALRQFLGSRRSAQVAHLLIGAGEMAIAALLLLPPERWWAMRLASGFAVGFLVYLIIARRVAPERICACMGGHAGKISRQSIARAGFVLVLTLIGWPAQTFWGSTIVAAPWTALVIVAEIFGLWLLSPEYSWKGPQITTRLVHHAQMAVNPTCDGIDIDWDVLDIQVQRTVQFQTLATPVTTRLDHWRDGCWSYIAYHVDYEDQPATAVFAAPALFDARDVSAVVVNDADDTILLALASLSKVVPATARKPAAVSQA